MKRRILQLNILLTVLTVILCLFYGLRGGVQLKSLTCSGFALLGIVNLWFCTRARCPALRFPVLLTLGLLVCMAGDIALNLHFLAGAAIFASGHILYLAAYGVLDPFHPRDLLPALGIFGCCAALILLTPLFDFGDPLIRWVCLLYALIISCMLSKAIANYYRTPNRVTGILLLGSSLFFFSDVMLCLDFFSNASDITGYLCLFTYFPGQCVLAHSLYHYADN